MNEEIKPQKGSCLSWIVIAVIIIGILGLIGSCLGNSSEDDKAKTCQVCHKSFTNKDDVKSIIWSNMCERCHDNYEYTQELKEALKKYEENYG